MSFRKKQNWQTLLHEFLELRGPAPFAWGSNDCALFAADAVMAMTGADMGAPVRGKYTDQAGAVAAMETITGKPDATAMDLALHLCSLHGLPQRKSLLFAQRGDIVVLTNPDGSQSLGIVALDGRHALFVTEAGLRRMKVGKCAAAWQVG
jgi:hypothetical protein